MASRKRAPRLREPVPDALFREWESEDFQDSPSHQLEEIDPWIIPPSSEHGNRLDGQQTAPETMATDGPPPRDLPPSKSIAGHGYVTDQPGIPDTSISAGQVEREFDDVAFIKETAVHPDEMATPWRLQEVYPDSLGSNGLQVDETYDEQYDFLLEYDDFTRSFDELPIAEIDEPLPIAEYDDSRVAPLYDPGSSHFDRYGLEVDEWLANIDTTHSEVRFIKEHLRSYTNARLGSWLAWASSRQWTGRLLVLFLQFEDYCRSHAYMWENLGGYGDPYVLDGVISRDASYELVGTRSDLPADRIIDPDWYKEWMRTEPRILVENGFRSFGSFAVYRSQSSDALDLDFVSESFPKFLTLNHYREWPEWLSHQDWYDVREWHDNLA